MIWILLQRSLLALDVLHPLAGSGDSGPTLRIRKLASTPQIPKNEMLQGLTRNEMGKDQYDGNDMASIMISLCDFTSLKNPHSLDQDSIQALAGSATVTKHTCPLQVDKECTLQHLRR